MWSRNELSSLAEVSLYVYNRDGVSFLRGTNSALNIIQENLSLWRVSNACVDIHHSQEHLHGVVLIIQHGHEFLFGKCIFNIYFLSSVHPSLLAATYRITPLATRHVKWLGDIWVPLDDWIRQVDVSNRSWPVSRYYSAFALREFHVQSHSG